MIKKIILWALLIVLILLAILSYIGYRSFNQEAFKNQIVETIQELTGRTFSVNGPYALTWDPLPTMTLENVALSNLENSVNKQMFKAGKIQVQIEWASLLKSPTRIKNIIIVNPEVLVERISRSVTNINFPKLFATGDTMLGETMLGEQKKQAKIDNVHVENGTLQYINQMTKQTYKLTQITGEIAIGSLSGPFGFDGKATISNVPFKINASIDKHEISRPMSFLIDLTSKESDAHIKLDGQLFPDDPEKYLDGHGSLDIQKPNVLLHQVGLPDFPNTNNKQTIGNCAFNVNATNTTISDMILKIGSEEQDPALNMNWKHTNSTKTTQLNLDVSNLNLDDWKQTFLAAAEQKLLNDTKQTNFDINVANLIWNKQLATALHLAGTVTADQIKIDKGSVLLPGSTTAQITGLIGTDPNYWMGMADINLQTPNLATALPFFNFQNQKLVDVLSKTQRADLSVALQWTPKSATVTIPSLTLNETTGTAHYEREQGKPTDIILELNNLDMNKYVAFKTDEPRTFKQIEALLFDKIEHMPQVPSDTNAQISLNQVLVGDLLFPNITANIEANKNDWKIETVADTDQQDSFVLQSELNNVGTSDWQTTQTSWELQGQNLPQFLQALNVTTDDNILRNTRSFSFSGQLEGRPGDWNTTCAYQTQQMILEANGQLVNGHPENMAIHLHHISIPHLLVTLMDQNPMPLLTGIFDGQALLNQTDNILTLSNIHIQAHNQTLMGEATFDTEHNEAHVTLSADTLDATKFLPDITHFYLSASGFDTNPFQFDLLKKIVGSIQLSVQELIYQTSVYTNAAIQMHLANNTLTLDDFVASGEDGNSTIQARGTLEFDKTPTLNLKLVTQQLPNKTPVAMFDGIGLSGGRLTSEWNLATSGETPLQMARTLSGTGRISLDETTFIGADFSTLNNMMNQAQERQETQQVFEPKFKHALENGATPVFTVSGGFAIKDGLWQLTNGKVETKEASCEALNIAWDIPTATLKAIAPFKWNAYPALPVFILNLIKDKRGVSYTADIAAFASGLADEFQHQKIERDEAAIQAKRETLRQELTTAKEKAIAAQQRVQEYLQKIEQELEQVPSAVAQNTFKTAQITHQNLSEMIQQQELNTTQYQYIATQAEKNFESLQKAEKALLQQQIQNTKDKAANLMPSAQDAILKLNEMYQKRPTMTLLADLLQNAENQRGIMERAIDQFKKDLTFEQTTKVADIIQSAYNKIMKAYNYAEEIYSGRQSTPNSNTIKRSGS